METKNNFNSKNFIRVIGTIGAIIFTYYLPQLWWQVEWKDLFYIVSNKTDTIKLTNELSKILQGLGITQNNLHSWAFERIMICIGIGLGIIIVLFLLTMNINKKEQK